MENKDREIFSESEMEVEREVIIFSSGKDQQIEESNPILEDNDEPQRIYVEEPEEKDEGMEKDEEEELEFILEDHEGELFVRIDDEFLVGQELFQLDSNQPILFVFINNNL